MDISRCKVMVPGSSANVGSGFDVFGLAVSIYSYFSLQNNNEITYIGRDDIDKDLAKNTVFTSFSRVLKEFKQDVPKVGIWIKNHIPIKRGLGSSSVAIIGGLSLGYVYLLSRGLLTEELSNFNTFKERIILPLGVEIEGHPDNITPSVVGGFTVSGIDGSMKYYKVSVPENLHFVFVIPEFDVSTQSARSVLPEKYERKDVISNIRSAISLILGFINNDPDLISVGLNDRLHQPYRSNLYKGFEKLLKLSKNEVSERFIGSFVSGSGPTICCVFYSQPSFSEIEKLRDFLKLNNLTSYDIQILSVDNYGTRLIET
ncbi:MAG: homoserine kinase [Spirochaetia bacterium]|nr:homoserine kinase [Spirochaetota bacterium]MCX8096033.1 homoserine kinase [Spirochaetota bacterium]MDW8111828.1 homoserine kinase [Spirochaetia bacterium]